MRLRLRRLTAVVALVLAAPGAPGAPAAAQEPPPAPLPATPNAGPCAVDSWVGGSVDLCAGTLVYRDYLYDDYGADSGSLNAGSTGTIGVPAGDQRYSSDVNSADLVDLALWIDGGRLRVVAELNALFNPDSTVLALAIDTDDDAQTGGGEWPGLGITSTGWDVLETFDTGDPDTNLITGSLPLPPGDRWRVQAVTAVNGGPVMNVAFRGIDEEAGRGIVASPRPDSSTVGSFWEDKQSRALADGDISMFGHTVDVADLRNGVTRPAPAVTGFHQRVYTSAYTLPPGEGMDYTGYPGRGTGGPTGAFRQIFHFHGKYQPYGMYVPTTKPAPHGLQFLYHGSNANHASLVNQPGAQQNIGEEHNRVLAVPLARGPHGYGSDISERDQLDVLADVLANHDVDRDRIYASGYSQGGYVAFRMALLYPHLFAGVVSWVGFTGDAGNGTPSQGDVTAGAVGNMLDFARNGLHVPMALMYGGTDELVHVTSSNAMAQQFRDIGSPYIYYLHPPADHFTFALTDDWRKETVWTEPYERVARPSRVLFRTADFLGNPDYDIRHDRAYWVSQIRGREEAFIDVDVTGACRDQPVTEEGMTAGPDPVPWGADYRNRTGFEPVDPETPQPALAATLVNVSALTVDTTEACLTDGSIPYTVTTDGPATLHLDDGRRLALPEAGTFEGVLAPRADIETACPPGRVPRSAYGDVRGNLHRDAIDCVTWYGVAKGVTPSRYAPAATVTRGQMASFMVRLLDAAGKRLPRPERIPFDDIAGNTHRDAIERLAEADLVQGVARRRFAPDRAVTRGQMATFLARAFGHAAGALPAVGPPDYYTDDDGSVHEDDINFVTYYRFASGVGGGRFAPGRDVRRDQMASFVARTLNQMVDWDMVSPPDR